MKKFTSLAASLIAATAFCGFCAGCASEINNTEAGEAPAVGVTTSADSVAHKVILNPGWYYNGSTKTMNTIGTGATKLTAPTANYLENAYECTVATAAALPTPTTGRSGVTFQGWRYAKDGNLVTVKEMPDASGLESDLILYAHWLANNNGGSSTGTGGGTGGGEASGTVSSTGTKVIFSDGEIIFNFEYPSWATDGPYLYIWAGSTEVHGTYANGKMKGDTVTTTVASTECSLIFHFFEGKTEKKTADIKLTSLVKVGGTYTISIGGWGSGGSANTFTPTATKV